ncbi:MAG: hypothetical protein JW778_02740 [Candidatus Altiarchaeota archaeon]|nr:hypothetical protein [Candidatus Altiarchaeota archaeon]
MYSAWDKKEKKKESVLSKYAKHLGISAVVLAALMVIIVILVVWWFYGYHYVIVLKEEMALTAVNSTL